MIGKLLTALSKTLFPPICNVCGCKLKEEEVHLCDGCLSQLPVTYNWHAPQNNVYDRINKEVHISAVVTLFHYRAGDSYTNIILNAKFRNQRKMAYWMGFVMAQYIKNCEAAQHVDYIIPLPLHSSRKRWRGYNQSDYIAMGLSDGLSVEILKGVVIRHKKSRAQSKLKGTRRRHENVKGVFSVTDKEILKNKRIMLVDDVITTGATISSCVKAIKKTAPTSDVVCAALSSTE